MPSQKIELENMAITLLNNSLSSLYSHVNSNQTLQQNIRSSESEIKTPNSSFTSSPLISNISSELTKKESKELDPSSTPSHSFNNVPSKLSNEEIKQSVQSSIAPLQEGDLSSSLKLTNGSGWYKKISGTLYNGFDGDILKSKVQSLEEEITRAQGEIKEFEEKLKKVKDEHALKVQEQKNIKEQSLFYKMECDISNLWKNINLFEKKIKEIEEIKADTELKLEILSHRAYHTEIFKQYRVQKHFFDPRRSKAASTKQIAERLQEIRLNEKNIYNIDMSLYKTEYKIGPNKLEKMLPSRRIISAERSVIEASLPMRYSESNLCDPNNNGGVYAECNLTITRNQLGWRIQRGYLNNSNSSQWECVQLDDGEDRNLVIIKYYYLSSGCMGYHLGNYYMDMIGTYSDILTFLHRLANSSEEKPDVDNEKKLANLMLKYARTGIPASLDELKQFNATVNTDRQLFVSICYHVFVKENSRRMPCSKEYAKYEIPVTIIQARAIKLIAAGVLSLKDVFALDAPYGVVSAPSVNQNHSSVIKKIICINKKYNEYILKTPEYNSKFTSFFEKNPAGLIIASKKQLRKELQETYGGSSDTDGEGYSSEEEPSSPTFDFL